MAKRIPIRAGLNSHSGDNVRQAPIQQKGLDASRPFCACSFFLVGYSEFAKAVTQRIARESQESRGLAFVAIGSA